jgi:hypothetical protein
MRTEPDKTRFGRMRPVFKTGGALLAVVLAGPVLTIAITSILLALLLGGCMALIVVGAPFAAMNQPDRQAEIHATASVEAALLAQPLPTNVEFFVEADRWNFSPSGDHALLQVKDRFLMMNVTTQERREIEMPFSVGTDDTAWLDDRRLFVYQSQATQTGYGFVLFTLSETPNLEVQKWWLPAVRADRTTAALLVDKDLFQNESPYEAQVVAIGETEGWVIDAYDPHEREAFERMMADRAITTLPPFYSRFEWRPQEAYDAPDGSYYAAIRDRGMRLTIVRPGGEVVVEVNATDFGLAQVNCHLTPIRWRPDSRGVLFAVKCGGIQRSILLLSIPA